MATRLRFESANFASVLPIRTAISSPSQPRCRRSEEHTSELQSQSNLVCRLLLEKKNSFGDKAAYAIRTTEYGHTWTRLVTAQAATAVRGSCHLVTAHLDHPSLIFLGMQVGTVGS